MIRDEAWVCTCYSSSPSCLSLPIRRFFSFNSFSKSWVLDEVDLFSSSCSCVGSVSYDPLIVKVRTSAVNALCLNSANDPVTSLYLISKSDTAWRIS